jgi:hypothetical protein
MIGQGSPIDREGLKDLARRRPEPRQEHGQSKGGIPIAESCKSSREVVPDAIRQAIRPLTL